MFFRIKPLEFLISLGRTDISEAINKILFIVEKCENPRLKGLCFLIKSDRSLTVIASNGFRLVAISFPGVVIRSPGRYAFFIHLDQIPIFVSRLQSGPVSFSIVGERLVFSDGYKINCLPNSPLSSYEAIIPKLEGYQFSIQREEIERFQDPTNSELLVFPFDGSSKKVTVYKEFFLDAFKVLGDRLRVSIKGDEDPILIKGEDKNIIYLLMAIIK